MDFSEEQDFPESNLITADHVGKPGFSRSILLQRSYRTPPEQPFPDSELCWRSFTVLFSIPLWKWRSGEELLQISRA
jgi:hypothetical protein